MIFGGNLPINGTMAGLIVGEEAIVLPAGDWRPIGDLDGPDADDNSFDDLAAAVMSVTGKLKEAGETEHQVVHVFLSGPRGELIGGLGAPDIVFEPGRASFSDPGTEQVNSIYFGPLGLRVDGDGQERTLLGISGPAGDALRVYDGALISSAENTVLPPILLQEPELFVFDLANATAPGFVSTPPSGVDLANDAAPDLRDAVGLEGRFAEEHLSGSVSMPDFNGDGFNELLVFGDRGSYLLLGPVELGDMTDVAPIADLIIDASVGRPASRMGDVTGDGLADLVFLRPTAFDDFEIIIIAGGNGAGIELPRVIDNDWVQATLGVLNQERVQVRPGSVADAGGAGYAESSTSLAVLNWNDDGFADILITRADAPLFAVQGFVFSGLAMWGQSGPIAFSPGDVDTDTLVILASDTSERDGAARQMLGLPDGETPPAYVETPDTRAVVGGDINGDGLDDILLINSGYIDFDDETLPNIGRAYVIQAPDPAVGVDGDIIWLNVDSDAAPEVSARHSGLLDW